jgi:hypothetical protein
MNNSDQRFYSCTVKVEDFLVPKHRLNQSKPSAGVIVVNRADPKLAVRLLKVRNRITNYDASSGAVFYAVQQQSNMQPRRWLRIVLPLAGLSVLSALAMSQKSIGPNELCLVPELRKVPSTAFIQSRELQLGGIVQVTLENECNERYQVTLEAKRRTVVAVKPI